VRELVGCVSKRVHLQRAHPIHAILNLINLLEESDLDCIQRSDLSYEVVVSASYRVFHQQRAGFLENRKKTRWSL
jgi:hypothetical protein